MSMELLEDFTRQYIGAQTQHEILFTWHGGEPLLLPIHYYEQALLLQQKYAGGHHIDNCLQTNGTLLTDEWCEFLAKNHFLVGISIDGPESMHEHYRQQFDRVVRSIALLKKHGVMWNAMATVNRHNADDPLAFYDFFRDIGCQYLQFTPVVEPGTSQEALVTPESVLPGQWGSFLTTLYDEWVKGDVGRIFVQLFDATLACWVGEPPSVCTMGEHCGQAAALQPDGSLYCCDHFVFPEYLLGNIRHHTITELMYGPRQRAFGKKKKLELSDSCRACRFLFACHGECPKNRLLPGNGNYLCQGYRQYFGHVAADMDFMAQELLAGRAPANIMDRKATAT